MAEKKGVARLRQAIENQASAGEASFSLPADEARALLRECEDELERVSWAEGIPAPVDADGEAVPLTTRVMYDEGGEECRIDGFRLSLDPSESSSWWAGYVVVGFDTGGYVKDLHLRRSDSWERLEEDVARIGSADYPCDYFNHADCGMPCYSCPAHTDAEDCTAGLARDVLRRAKALAERDTKGSTPQPSPHEAKGAGRA